MCDSSTVGSTPPCQGGGRGFESRLSLFCSQGFPESFFILQKLHPTKQKRIAPAYCSALLKQGPCLIQVNRIFAIHPCSSADRA